MLDHLQTGKLYAIRLGDSTWKIGVSDEEGIDNDPTLLIFLEDEEEARATVHLNEDAPCTDPDHIVAVYVGG